MNIKLLKDLDFASKIIGTEAVTEAGKEMIKNYKAYLFTNPASCGIVNGFVQEAQKFSFDTGLASILESVLNFINENKISWQLASACESIENNQSTYNYIAKTGVEQVSKLLEMDESQVVSYIKSGALKGVQYIPEFRNVCKQVFKSTINEEVAATYAVTAPVSFVYENEEGTKYFNILNRTYKMTADNKSVSEAVCDEVKFRNINALLESFANDEGVISYEWKSGFDQCKVVIKEENKKDTLTFTKGNKVNETFENNIKFIEYCDILSKTMTMNERFDFMNKTKAIADVFEAFGNIYVIDTAKVLRTSTGSICTIIEAQDNVQMTVNASVHAGTYTKNFDFVIEALKEVTSVTGIDLKHLYEKRINEDVKKKNPDQYQNIQEELEAAQKIKMDERKKKIAMLAEQNKNNPAIISVLNTMARDLALLENQKTLNESKPKYQVDPYIMQAILYGIKYGYLVTHINGKQVKFGVSEENIYYLIDENDIPLGIAKEIIDDLLHNQGYKCKYKTDAEFKKDGLTDPNYDNPNYKKAGKKHSDVVSTDTDFGKDVTATEIPKFNSNVNYTITK